MKNFYEEEARAAKLRKLLDAADAFATEGGLDPKLHALGIAESWRSAKPEHFRELVKRAKVNVPSTVTLSQFQDALDHRAGM